MDEFAGFLESLIMTLQNFETGLRSADTCKSIEAEREIRRAVVHSIHACVLELGTLLGTLPGLGCLGGLLGLPLLLVEADLGVLDVRLLRHLHLGGLLLLGKLGLDLQHLELLRARGDLGGYEPLNRLLDILWNFRFWSRRYVPGTLRSEVDIA